MLSALVRGLLFGAGFGVAFLGVVGGVILYLSNNPIEVRSRPKIEVPPGESQAVVPMEQTEDRGFELYKTPAPRMAVPPGGGVLSIAIADSPKGAKRPSTVQAWVTESKAYLIKTDGTTPTVSEVTYPVSEPERFASQLVAEHAGFRKGNSTMTISAGDVGALKGGRSSHQSDHLNGTLRITSEGVVFFLPNEFET